MKINIGKFSKTSRKRNVKIETHDFDFWSLDHTFSLIITPVLIEFRDRYNNFSSGTPSGLSREEWLVILDEMIWSFDQIANEEKDEPDPTDFGFLCSSEEKFQKCFLTPKGKVTHYFSGCFPTEEDQKRWVVAMKEYEKRIQHGLSLFGRYLRNLWE